MACKIECDFDMFLNLGGGIHGVLIYNCIIRHAYFYRFTLFFLSDFFSEFNNNADYIRALTQEYLIALDADS